MEQTLSASELGIEVEGVQTINVDTLESEYGEEFAEFIKRKINGCIESQREWKLEILDQSQHTADFIFATHSYAYFLEVSTLRKVILEKNFVHYSGCEKALKLMKECSDRYWSDRGL